MADERSSSDYNNWKHRRHDNGKVYYDNDCRDKKRKLLRTKAERDQLRERTNQEHLDVSKKRKQENAGHDGSKPLNKDYSVKMTKHYVLECVNGQAKLKHRLDPRCHLGNFGQEVSSSTVTREDTKSWDTENEYSYVHNDTSESVPIADRSDVSTTFNNDSVECQNTIVDRSETFNNDSVECQNTIVDRSETRDTMAFAQQRKSPLPIHLPIASQKMNTRNASDKTEHQTDDKASSDEDIVVDYKGLEKLVRRKLRQYCSYVLDNEDGDFVQETMLYLKDKLSGRLQDLQKKPELCVPLTEYYTPRNKVHERPNRSASAHSKMTVEKRHEGRSRSCDVEPLVRLSSPFRPERLSGRSKDLMSQTRDCQSVDTENEYRRPESSLTRMHASPEHYPRYNQSDDCFNDLLSLSQQDYRSHQEQDWSQEKHSVDSSGCTHEPDYLEMTRTLFEKENTEDYEDSGFNMEKFMFASCYQALQDEQVGKGEKLYNGFGAQSSHFSRSPTGQDFGDSHPLQSPYFPDSDHSFTSSAVSNCSSPFLMNDLDSDDEEPYDEDPIPPQLKDFLDPPSKKPPPKDPFESSDDEMYVFKPLFTPPRPVFNNPLYTPPVFTTPVPSRQDRYIYDDANAFKPGSMDSFMGTTDAHSYGAGMSSLRTSTPPRQSPSYYDLGKPMYDTTDENKEHGFTIQENPDTFDALMKQFSSIEEFLNKSPEATGGMSPTHFEPSTSIGNWTPPMGLYRDTGFQFTISPSVHATQYEFEQVREANGNRSFDASTNMSIICPNESQEFSKFQFEMNPLTSSIFEDEPIPAADFGNVFNSSPVRRSPKYQSLLSILQDSTELPADYANEDLQYLQPNGISLLSADENHLIFPERNYFEPDDDRSPALRRYLAGWDKQERPSSIDTIFKF